MIYDCRPRKLKNHFPMKFKKPSREYVEFKLLDSWDLKEISHLDITDNLPYEINKNNHTVIIDVTNCECIEQLTITARFKNDNM